MAVVNKAIPAGGTVFIQKGTNIFSTSDDWIFGARNEISGHFFAGHVAGAVLELQISFDGITFDSYHWWPLVGAQLTFISEFSIPAYIGRFRLHNNSAGTIQTITGNLQIRGK
jgi:hypothetical protein